MVDPTPLRRPGGPRPPGNVSIDLAHLLPEDQVGLSVDFWMHKRAQCDAILRATPPAWPVFPASLLGWLLFCQWRFDETGAAPFDT